MSAKVKGIVISSIDYKEKDKLINIFTPDKGVITATLKSVRSANAKLKYAKEMFCFAEFILEEKNGYNTVISADLIDSFFDITKNYDRFVCATNIIKLLPYITKQGEEAPELFVEVLKSVTNLTYSDIASEQILLLFLIRTLRILGYTLDFRKCNLCGVKTISQAYFDVETCEFSCSNCRGDAGIEISQSLSSTVRILSEKNYDDLSTIKIKTQTTNEAISLLLKAYSNITGKVIKFN